MDIKIDKTSLKKHEFSTDELLTRIASGKAILFTGAGFSLGSKNVYQASPPNAKDLAKSICKLGEFEEDDDLRFAADYFLESRDKAKLINLLKESFTLTEVTQSQINICKANWRRHYTTNYDKSIEMASAQAGKFVECVDLDYSPKEFYKKKGICIHLNGSIDSLNEDAIEKSFKLSTSSYITPDSFINSDWYYPFKQDLERCSAIVFVGYSMYDIEIQKVLFENSELKEKTYFITQVDPNPKTQFTISKFGHVVPIGAENFARKLAEKIDSQKPVEEEFLLESFVKFDISYANEPARDSDIEAMLMYGDVRQSHIDNAVVGAQEKPFLIIRDVLPKILELSQTKENIVLFGEFGNGKSLIINELLPFLSVNSFDVYSLVDKGGDYIGDIEKIALQGKRSILVIDGYESQLDILKHIAILAPSNISLVLTARTSDHERLRSSLKNIEFKFSEINVDFLSIKESDFLVKILDNIGLWGAQAHLTHERKMRYLERDNQMQISLALLTIFDSPQMAARIKDVISDLFDTSNFKDTVFSIAILEILNSPNMNSSFISEVAMNNTIYDANFRSNNSFKQMFKFSGNSVISKSSLFCQSLIKNHFEASYITSQLQKIAKKFSAQQGNSFAEERIFKATLRFSFIERLLPTHNKKSNLFKYYEDLKVSVPWLVSDPHYWVQYAMARIPYKDYTKAQSCLDHAYGLAKNKFNYHTSNIDTQQGRLYLLKAIESVDQSEASNHFKEAHKTFSSLDDDVYKFRQIEKYRDYFESQFKNLSRPNRAYLVTCCQQVLKTIERAANSGSVNLAHQKAVAKTHENLSFILSRAS